MNFYNFAFKLEILTIFVNPFFCFSYVPVISKILILTVYFFIYQGKHDAISHITCDWST